VPELPCSRLRSVVELFANFKPRGLSRRQKLENLWHSQLITRRKLLNDTDLLKHLGNALFLGTLIYFIFLARFFLLWEN